MNEQELNKRELERLQKCYPLFTFELEKNGINNLTVHYSKTNKLHTSIENGHLFKGSAEYLEHEHLQKSLSKAFMLRYPDLYISVYCSKDDCNVSVWVNRPNEQGEADDAESIDNISITNIYLHKWLADCQIEAKKAKQDGWFFCSGHKLAEPKEEYGYFYFAGNYCKKYGETNSEHRRMAARENYN